MRSLLAIVLGFTLLVSTTFAQVGPSPRALTRPDSRTTPLDPAAAPAMPTALDECDGDQCENPRSGGAVWLFAGKEGQGMWLYQAVTKLTVVEFDGRIIQIHREDPEGTYSSHFVNGGGKFTADYFGTITGNVIKGTVYWGGNMKSGTPWHATIVNWDFCTERAERCPLHPDQLSVLGRRASEAGMYAAAFRCFEIAAQEGDADGKGFEATMMMNGWGGKHAPAEIVSLLQNSANHDSYPGEKGLARAYEQGVIVAKNPQQAAYWNDRANTRQARLEEQEKSRANQLTGKVLGAWLVVGILMAAMVGSGSGSSYSDEESYRQQMKALKLRCNAFDTDACEEMNRLGRQGPPN